VPEVVGKEPLAAAVVVTALEVVIILDVVIGGLGASMVEEDETGACEIEVLMVVGTLDAAPGTHCEYQSLLLSQ
jgi:hypothetical protein